MAVATTCVAALSGPGDGTAAVHGMEVPYEVVDGLAVWEGHVILGTAEEVAGWSTESWRIARGNLSGRITTLAPPGKRADGTSCLWPDGVIPYVIDDDVPGRDRILRAIGEWDSKTVLRFVERASHHELYLRFTTGPRSGAWLCQAGVTGELSFSIEPGGSNYEVILHGIGHSIGLAHEQQRRGP